VIDAYSRDWLVQMGWSPEKEPDNIHDLGLWLGYPRCCVSAFLVRYDIWPKPTPSPGPGHGYIPCPKCSEKGVSMGWPKFIEEIITPNRMCPDPFPTWHT
jgi:hypothetical protein